MVSKVYFTVLIYRYLFKDDNLNKWKTLSYNIADQ